VVAIGRIRRSCAARHLLRVEPFIIARRYSYKLVETREDVAEMENGVMDLVRARLSADKG
jgi:hypothetical protein